MTRRNHDLGLRLIIFFKVVKMIVLIALGISGLVMSKSRLYVTAHEAVDWVGIAAARKAVHQLLDISDKRVRLMALGSLAYAAVFACEAWFLHRRKVWAEWFTVAVTASLLPFEIYELVHHFTIGKVVTLIVNILVVIYLVIRRLHDRS